MRIGYPYINQTIGCSPARTFRLASYSEERFQETVNANLSCLRVILDYNVRHGILLFRITSDLVLVASHPVCRFQWQKNFSGVFQMIGKYIHNNTLRISMHPDRFVLLNTPNDDVLQRSVTDFRYQVAVLNLFGLDASAKIQIHVRDVYGDKKIVRTGSSKITLRSILPSGGGSFENDERLYTVANCCALHERTGVPVLFDVFHHSVHNNGEKIPDIMDLVFTT